MIKQNLHTHSTFSDGVNTPEEIVLTAIEKGFTSIGFSEHAYTPYDLDCCIKKEDIPVYFAEINRLKQKYEGKLDIFLGFECDSYYETDKFGLDYTIGSKHYAFDEITMEYLAIDYMTERFEQAVKHVGSGDVSVLVKLYYSDLARYVIAYQPDIIGHVDLIAKLNHGNRYFDLESAWYRRLLDETAATIAKTGAIVEINTGGMYRSGLKYPYPSPEFLSRLYENRVPVTISADAHCAEAIDFWFDEAARLIKKTGYRSVKQLTADGFIDVEVG